MTDSTGGNGTRGRRPEKSNRFSNGVHLEDGKKVNKINKPIVRNKKEREKREIAHNASSVSSSRSPSQCQVARH